MKLIEILNKKGKYVSVSFDHDTVQRLLSFIKQYDIPNPIDAKDLHSTVISSNDIKSSDFTPLGKLPQKWVGTPVKIIKIPPHCLALQYTCSKQLARHKGIIKDYKCTDTHNPYIMHTSLSYKIPTNYDIKSIDIKHIGLLHITHEHSDDLRDTPYDGKYK